MPVPPKDANTPRAPLHLMADCATAQANDERKPGTPRKGAPDKSNTKLVALAPAKDSAIIWKAASIHPTQPLQNVHQKLVRDKVRVATTDDEREAAESGPLQQFFYLDSAEPELLGIPENVTPPKFADEQLEDAVKKGGEVKKAMKEAAPDLAKAKTDLDAAIADMHGVIGLFANPVPGATMPDVAASSVLADALLDLANADASLKAAALTDVEVKAALKSFEAAGASVESAVSGYASIQNMHIIAPFYLFRMLVRFRIDSADKISSKDRAGISGQLTGFLNNNPNDSRRWLFDYLSSCIKDLDVELKKISTDNLIFFLKGGRALKFLEKDRLNGENDWDTQVVINPELPVDQWYDLFRQVHNVVLLRLKAYKLGFFMLMNANREAFTASITSALNELNPLDNDARPRTQAMSCKAELIDIGIPRYDTVECHEQWHMMHGNIKVEEGVPIPDFIYYINEYVLMIREAYADKSISITKTPKRVRRLYGIVTLDGMEDTVDSERAGIPFRSLPKTLPAIDAQNPAAKAVLTVLSRQFGQAYDLAWDPGLAAAFDNFIDAEKADLGAKVVSPQKLQDAVTADGAAFKEHHRKLAGAIGFGQLVSTKFEAHLRKRGEWLWNQRKELGRLVKAVYTASVFKPEDELELQFAVNGSFAAGLYADYYKFPSARATEIEGMSVLDVTVFCQKEGVRPHEVARMMRPWIDAYLRQPKTPKYEVVVGPMGGLHLFWPQVVDFGEGFRYKPRVIRFTVETNAARWPNLGFVWGYPVVSLRDLIREYDRRAAHFDEFGTQQRLKKTSAALVEILTNYESKTADAPMPQVALPTLASAPPALPPPAPATLKAIADGNCHYLLISSAQGANSRAGSYPDTYAAGEQFLIRVPTAAGTWKVAIPAGAGADRVLNLLVVNQGHGDIGTFGNFSAAEIKSKIVDPLVAAHVTASTIVLDFCLSATLVATFEPLLAAGGRIISTMYSAPAIVVTNELLGTEKAHLAGRDQARIDAAIDARLTQLTAANTAYTNMQILRDPAPAGDAYVGEIAGRDAPSADRASAIRYLSQIVGAVTVNGAAAAAPSVAMQGQLVAVKTTAELGPNEVTVVAPVPDLGTDFTAMQFGTVLTRLRARLLQVLTDGAYNIGRDAGALGAVPTVGNNSLWSLIAANQEAVLRGAPGLTKLPSIFAVYAKATTRLSLDAVYTAPLTGRVPALLDLLFRGSAAEVPKVNVALATLTMDGRANYLQ